MRAAGGVVKVDAAVFRGKALYDTTHLVRKGREMVMHLGEASTYHRFWWSS